MSKKEKNTYLQTKENLTHPNFQYSNYISPYTFIILNIKAKQCCLGISCISSYKWGMFGHIYCCYRNSFINKNSAIWRLWWLDNYLWTSKTEHTRSISSSNIFVLGSSVSTILNSHGLWVVCRRCHGSIALKNLK